MQTATTMVGQQFWNDYIKPSQADRSFGASPWIWVDFWVFRSFFEDLPFSRKLAGVRGHSGHTNSSRRTHPRYPEPLYYPRMGLGPLFGPGPWARGWAWAPLWARALGPFKSMRVPAHSLRGFCFLEKVVPRILKACVCQLIPCGAFVFWKKRC